MTTKNNYAIADLARRRSRRGRRYRSDADGPATVRAVGVMPPPVPVGGYTTARPTLTGLHAPPAAAPHGGGRRPKASKAEIRASIRRHQKAVRVLRKEACALSKEAISHARVIRSLGGKAPAAACAVRGRKRKAKAAKPPARKRRRRSAKKGRR